MTVEKEGCEKRYSKGKLECWEITGRIYRGVRYLGIIEVLNTDFYKGMKRIRADLRQYEVHCSVSNAVSVLHWFQFHGVVKRKDDEYMLTDLGSKIRDDIHRAIENKFKDNIILTNRVHQKIWERMRINPVG